MRLGRFSLITQLSQFSQLYYAEITQKLRRQKYSIIEHFAQSLRKGITQKYANKLRKSLRRLRNHYAIQLRKYEYAIPQKVITQITQILISITQKFCSLRNGQLADVGLQIARASVTWSGTGHQAAAAGAAATPGRGPGSRGPTRSHWHVGAGRALAGPTWSTV